MSDTESPPKRAIYAGTFDPLTNGHIDLVLRGLKLFPEVVVAIASNPGKSPLFSLDERVALAQEILAPWPNAKVIGFSSLLVDFAQEMDASVILRGLRAISDFEFEFQLALMNRRLNKNIETVFLTPAESHTFTSASLVKEIARLGGDVSQFVPERIYDALREKLA